MYKDKLVDEEDMDSFEKLIKETLRKYFDDMPEENVLATPLVFWHFAAGGDDPL